MSILVLKSASQVSRQGDHVTALLLFVHSNELLTADFPQSLGILYYRLLVHGNVGYSFSIHDMGAAGGRRRQRRRCAACHTTVRSFAGRLLNRCHTVGKEDQKLGYRRYHGMMYPSVHNTDNI
jgi:hypothetical protein